MQIDQAMPMPAEEANPYRPPSGSLMRRRN